MNKEAYPGKIEETYEHFDEFIKYMRDKLDANMHKPSIDGKNYGYLYGRLNEETQELLDEIPFGKNIPLNIENLRNECADVANFAYLIFLKTKRNEEKNETV